MSKYWFKYNYKNIFPFFEIQLHAQKNVSMETLFLNILLLDSREEELDDLAGDAVAQKRGLVSLADGPQQTPLAIKTQVEQEVLRILEDFI